MVRLSVTKNQPYLTGFPTQICGKIRRSLQDSIARHRQQLRETSICSYGLQFSHLLPPEYLNELSTSKRVRHYCNVVVFWAWLAMILEANASLAKGVSLIQAWAKEAGIPRPAKDTGAFSKGRERLSIDFIRAVAAKINESLAAGIRPEDTYRGHIIKSIDGSSMAADDTEANQIQYPQPSSQKPGCGFPVMGIMGVLNHAHGGWEDFVEGEQSAHDAPIYRKLLHCFKAGDILCGDRAFCTYELKATMCSMDVDTLMRLHQARHRALDWRKGKRIGKNQRIVTWKKPVKQSASSTMSAQEWAQLPEKMSIRLIRFYYRDRNGCKRRMVLATTLLDHETYDWKELAALYAQRWDIELRLRDVKTTLKMEHLRAKKPETLRKNLIMSLIAYNLIKASSQQAAQNAGEDLRLISFKGALDTIVANTSRYLRRQKHVRVMARIWSETIEMIAENLIDLRPDRQEPRALKKRPKSFSYLTKPRHVFKEIPHRGKSRSCA